MFTKANARPLSGGNAISVSDVHASELSNRVHSRNRDVLFTITRHRFCAALVKIAARCMGVSNRKGIDSSGLHRICSVVVGFPSRKLGVTLPLGSKIASPCLPCEMSL